MDNSSIRIHQFWEEMAEVDKKQTEVGRERAMQEPRETAINSNSLWDTTIIRMLVKRRMRTQM